MGKIAQNEYIPDYASPPGETLLEVLDSRGITPDELAEHTGQPQKTIHEIIKGQAAITPETALQLETVLGISATFWNRREQQYREDKARLQDQKHQEQQVDWIKQFPVSAMIKRGWIERYKDPVAQLREVLLFFGITSPDQWSAASAAFRQSGAFPVDEGAIDAWLRQGERKASRIECGPYNEHLFRQTLTQIRALTREPPTVSVPEMIPLCAASGVVVVFVPELPGTRVCGATQWLTPTRALIQLSLRYKTDDQMWFSFFHEAGHIVLHGKQEFFLDVETKDIEQTNKEHEANTFASNMLIPPDKWQNLLETGQYRSKEGIVSFANDIGIAPSIVVGRLQHEEKIRFHHCNDLKSRIDAIEKLVD